MMKILITGANGFLGHYLSRALLEKNYPVLCTGKGPSRLPFQQNKNFEYISLDFTKEVEVEQVFENHNPTVIIHAGGMTKPDDCELDQPLAFNNNVSGTNVLLKSAARQQCFFIFVSTDFVFDGVKGMYQEDDLTGPVNYYGKTKLEAELSVKNYSGLWAIARTVLVYGKPLSGRSNILTVVKEKLERGETYNVVSDQVRTPTYVEDLARGIISILEKRALGVYHLSGAEVMTPFDMAIQTAQNLGLDQHLIKKVTADNFSQPATRPLRTGFIIDKARKDLGYDPISFKEGLIKTFG